MSVRLTDTARSPCRIWLLSWPWKTIAPRERHNGRCSSVISSVLRSSLPNANPERAVVVQTYGRDVLEQREHFHFPQLSDVQVGHPKFRVFVPGQLQLVRARVVQHPDPRIFPVHVQKHVQRYFLSHIRRHWRARDSGGFDNALKGWLAVVVVGGLIGKSLFFLFVTKCAKKDGFSNFLGAMVSCGRQ